jgi:hypothetical protein
MYMHKAVLYAHAACYMTTSWVNYAQVDWQAFPACLHTILARDKALVFEWR